MVQKKARKHERISPYDPKATVVIRNMKLCKPTCPVYDQCPVMPIAVQPKDPRVRHCLVNNGPKEIQRAYRNLFTKGNSGVIEEMQLTIMEYGKVLREEGKKEFTPKEKLRYLKDLNTMLQALEKLLPATKPDGEGGEDEPVEIDAGDGIDLGEEVEDPESLAGSTIVQEMLSEKGLDPLENPMMPKPAEVPEKSDVEKMVDKIFDEVK